MLEVHRVDMGRVGGTQGGYGTCWRDTGWMWDMLKGHRVDVGHVEGTQGGCGMCWRDIDILNYELPWHSNTYNMSKPLSFQFT